MKRLGFAAVGIMFTILLYSCAGTETATEAESQSMMAQGPYPSWYQQQPVVDQDTVLIGYATAIDSDSAASVQKAIAWAETELSATVADRMEAIRADLESSQKALSSPEFIFALANNQAVQEAAQTGRTEVETVEGYTSHRSFAEVRVPKGALVQALEQQLSQYEKAWNAITTSQAFKEYTQ